MPRRAAGAPGGDPGTPTVAPRAGTALQTALRVGNAAPCAECSGRSSGHSCEHGGVPRRCGLLVEELRVDRAAPCGGCTGTWSGTPTDTVALPPDAVVVEDLLAGRAAPRGGRLGSAARGALTARWRSWLAWSLRQLSELRAPAQCGRPRGRPSRRPLLIPCGARGRLQRYVHLLAPAAEPEFQGRSFFQTGAANPV